MECLHTSNPTYSNKLGQCVLLTLLLLSNSAVAQSSPRWALHYHADQEPWMLNIALGETYRINTKQASLLLQVERFEQQVVVLRVYRMANELVTIQDIFSPKSHQYLGRLRLNQSHNNALAAFGLEALLAAVVEPSSDVQLASGQ